MKKTRLYKYVYDFSIDHDSIDVADILGVYKYLMRKLNIKCLDLLTIFIGLLSVCTTGIFDRSLASNSKGPIKCVSLKISHVKQTLFYPFTVSVNKCCGSCKTVDDPYAQFWVPNKVSMNVK